MFQYLGYRLTNLVPLVFSRTNFVSNQIYSNSTGAQYRVKNDESYTPGVTAGVVGYMILVDPAGGNSWATNEDGTVASIIGSIAMPTHQNLNTTIPAGATYLFTNKTTLGTAALTVNTGEITAP